MAMNLVKGASYIKQTVCPYNDACRCDVKKCNNCGWNPTVAKRRLDKIQGRK